MMTIRHFDALTRPRTGPTSGAAPTDRALDIMKSEVSGGMLDQDLFGMFVEARVFEVQPEDVTGTYQVKE